MFKQIALSALFVMSGVVQAEPAREFSVPIGIQQQIPLVSEEFLGSKVAVRGLPAGLRYDATSGMIVGSALWRVTDKLVTVKVSTAGSTSNATFKVTTEPLPAWVRGSSFSGSGIVDGEQGSSALTVATSGKISGKIVLLSGAVWTVSASSFAARTDWGAYWTNVKIRRGRESKDAVLWLWSEDLGDGKPIGHYQIEQDQGNSDVAAEGWQSAFLREDLVDTVADVKGRLWTIETEQGILTFKGRTRGSLSVQFSLGRVKVTGSAQLLLTGQNVLGEPEYRTTVRLAARGKFEGLVWTGILDPAGGGDSPVPATLVTTTEDVVDPDDGVTSLREAVATGNVIGFDLPAGSDLKCVLTAPIDFSTTKTIDGALVRRIHGQNSTNRVSISGGKAVRLFSGPFGAVDLTFRNLVLEDGFIGPVGYAPKTCGGVVQALSWGTVTFENCLVRNNYVEGNGAVVAWYGRVVMTHSVFASNRANHMGGVVSLTSYYDSDNRGVMANDCTFTGNYSGSAGGVFRVDSGCRVADCVFEGNYCDNCGGVVMGKGSYWFTNCQFKKNTASIGGGVISVYTFNPSSEEDYIISAIDCVFTGNSAWRGKNIDNRTSYYTVDVTGSVFE